MAGSNPIGGSHIFGPPAGGGTTYRFGSGCGNNQLGGSGGADPSTGLQKPPRLDHAGAGGDAGSF